MITPDRQASRNVIARIGHELPSELTRALPSFGLSLMKNAMPGDSTVDRRQHSISQSIHIIEG